MTDEPSANGVNGRDAAGRFAEGNLGGPGNPHAKEVARLRSAMLNAVTVDDLRAIVTKLVDQAKAGSVPAAKEILDRCLGRNQAMSDLSWWMDRMDRQAADSASDAERAAQNRPEVLAERIGEASGIEPNVILEFVNQPKPEDLEDLAHELASASEVDHGRLVEFLNAQLDRLRNAPEPVPAVASPAD